MQAYGGIVVCGAPQTPDGQPDEPDAQQPKQGGNPVSAAALPDLSRTRYYDYYEAADLGIRLQDWLEDVAQEGTAALAQALPLLIPRLQDAFGKADDSDGRLGDAMYMAIGLLEEVVMENVTKRLINFLDKCLDDSRYFEYSEASNKIYQIRARIWRLRGEWQAWQDYVNKRLAVAKLDWDYEFWAFEGWQVLQTKGDTAAAQDFQTTSAPAEIQTNCGRTSSRAARLGGSGTPLARRYQHCRS